MRAYDSYSQLLQAPVQGMTNIRVLVQVDECDYQGDSFLIVRPTDRQDNRYGYLKIGWGSCSGCDALEACETKEDFLKLQRELLEQIVWFDNRGAMREWFRTHDWNGDYCANSAACLVLRTIVMSHDGLSDPIQITYGGEGGR